jgi:RNA polymerase sigma-70 factor, ECF subfamily
VKASCTKFVCDPDLGLSAEEFSAILQEICLRYLPPRATPAEQEQFCRALQLEDLALARACAKGNEIAWERFIARYQRKLHDAALVIAKEDSRARDLADSLHAELFGTRETSAGRRVSKFASYTGRGSLEGWLRTLLAQEYVNQLRRERRLVAFDDRLESPAATSPYAPRAADPRVSPAIEDALAGISSEERLILASYYLDNRTLAEIARMLGAHESTVSRKLDKITRGLRKKVLRALCQRGMSPRQAQEAMDCDVRDLSVNVGSKLLGGNIAARSRT